MSADFPLFIFQMKCPLLRVAFLDLPTCSHPLCSFPSLPVFRAQHPALIFSFGTYCPPRAFARPFCPDPERYLAHTCTSTELLAAAHRSWRWCGEEGARAGLRESLRQVHAPQGQWTGTSTESWSLVP